MASVRSKASLSRWQRALAWLRGFFYGMFLYEFERTFRKERGQLEQLFMALVFGDMVGLPILPPYYTLRLLPYVIPVYHRWKHSVLRERDLTDLAAD